MSKHGSHVGRKTATGTVISYIRNRYTAECNCGAQFRITCRQAQQNSLSCAVCWAKQKAETGKAPARTTIRPKRVRKPRPVNVG